MWHWIVQVSGARDESGAWYGLWSGFGGSIPDFLILGGLITFFRQRNCHQPRCWRLGRRHVGDGIIVCHRHHPDGKPTGDHIAAAAARRGQS